MSSRTYRLTALILFAVAGLCLAQNPPPEKPDGPQNREDRAKRKTRSGLSGAGAGRLGDSKRQLETMTRDIGLDETQQAAVKKLLETRDAGIRKAREAFRQTPEDIQRMKNIRDAMLAARDANDPKAMEEARKQAAAMREERQKKMVPARKALGDIDLAMHDGILKTLREDQTQRFETYWERRQPRRRPSSMTLRNPRALKALVLKLDDLDPRQKEQFETLFEQFQVDSRAASKAGTTKPDATKKALVKLRKKLFDDTAALLTPAQRTVLERKMRGRLAPPRPASGEKRGSGAQGAPDGKDGPGAAERPGQ